MAARRSVLGLSLGVRRLASVTPSKEALKLRIKETLNLPRTSMPMKYEPSLAESTHQATFLAKNIYNWQKKQNRPTFKIHDGPPYANGQLHMGHLLNKVLKDVINRAKLLSGHQIIFQPGWDCHGLPIELKAEESSRAAIQQGVPVSRAIRSAARELAHKNVASQKKSFEQWGIMGDWDEPYISMSPKFEAVELEILGAMHARGLINRRLKPVHWSPSTRTALAESELIYKQDHVSTAAYISFEMAYSTGCESLPSWLQKRLGESPVHAVIWTTTPWTIPANQAVCAGSEITYGCFLAECGKYYLVAHARGQDLSIALKQNLELVGTVQGAQLGGLNCLHPLSGRSVPLIASAHLTAHVTDESGTGLVHTAPAHGLEDFLVGQGCGLSLRCPVDASGRFTGATDEGAAFAGMEVLGQGRTAVLEKLKENNALLAASSYKHRYPYDWRTSKPVIFRTTPQWFADLESLKESALRALDEVEFLPSSGRSRLEKFINSRTEWCISRQRAWGVPIPAFYHKETGETLFTQDTISHAAELFKKHGSDAWFELETEKLLPPSIAHQAQEWARGEDTLDVWFDSGCSWAQEVATANKEVAEAQVDGGSHSFQHTAADLYVEGSDQHRGWFQSSLLTYLGAQTLPGKVAEQSSDKGQCCRPMAPYRGLLTHGFVVDESGVKMSKSMGNVVMPADLLGSIDDGGLELVSETSADMGGSGKPPRKKSKVGKGAKGGATWINSTYSVDVLRLWVAGSNWRGSDITIGPSVLGYMQELHRKLRNTCRFMVLNLEDFDHTRNALPLERLRSIDRWALHETAEYTRRIREHYDTFVLSRVIQDTEIFARDTLSSLYFHAIKDRLYCCDADSESRRAAQTVLHNAFNPFLMSIAPLMPFTAEEVFSYRHYANKKESVFHHVWAETPPEWEDALLAKSWRTALSVRKVVDKVKYDAIKSKKLSTSGAIHVQVLVESKESCTEILSHLSMIESDFNDLLGASASRVVLGAVSKAAQVVSEAGFLGEEEVDIGDERVIVRVHDSATMCEIEKCPRCYRHLRKQVGVGNSIMDGDWLCRGHPNSVCLDIFGEDKIFT